MCECVSKRELCVGEIVSFLKAEYIFFDVRIFWLVDIKLILYESNMFSKVPNVLDVLFKSLLCFISNSESKNLNCFSFLLFLIQSCRAIFLKFHRSFVWYFFKKFFKFFRI